VLDDRRANLGLAREIASGLEKDRRRQRDVLEKERDEVEQIRLQTELPGLSDQLLIANEQAALAEQRVLNATIEHDIKQISTRQTRAALTWVEAHLAPRETDLADAIERLDRLGRMRTSWQRRYAWAFSRDVSFRDSASTPAHRTPSRR
jgi:hypothetical protein